MIDSLKIFAKNAGDIVGGAVEGTDTVGLSVGEIVVIIINVVLWIIGILAVAMIIYGGVKYVMSQGDPGKVSTAQKTIIYAVVGLIIAILAYTIVGFVTNAITGKGWGGEAETEETVEGEDEESEEREA